MSRSKGELVTILNCSINGEVFIEGRARVVEHIQENQYFVHFLTKEGRLDEWGSVGRFVDPAAQANPEQYVKEQNARGKQS